VCAGRDGAGRERNDGVCAAEDAKCLMGNFRKSRNRGEADACVAKHGWDAAGNDGVREYMLCMRRPSVLPSVLPGVFVRVPDDDGVCTGAN
jgi:hypothetical protein